MKTNNKIQLHLKLNQLRYWVKHSLFSKERIMFLLLPTMFVFLLYFSVQSITKNWNLQQTLNTKLQEKQLMELKVSNMKLENQYYASEEYQELMARKLQDKKANGETMVMLPINSEIAKQKHANQKFSSNKSEQDNSNFHQWMRFLFRI
jgi:hypothetical protein